MSPSHPLSGSIHTPLLTPARRSSSAPSMSSTSSSSPRSDGPTRLANTARHGHRRTGDRAAAASTSTIPRWRGDTGRGTSAVVRDSSPRSGPVARRPRRRRLARPLGPPNGTLRRARPLLVPRHMGPLPRAGTPDRLALGERRLGPRRGRLASATTRNDDIPSVPAVGPRHAPSPLTPDVERGVGVPPGYALVQCAGRLSVAVITDR